MKDNSHRVLLVLGFANLILLLWLVIRSYQNATEDTKLKYRSLQMFY